MTKQGTAGNADTSEASGAGSSTSGGASHRRLTGSNTYFEDFTPGEMLRHARGRTIGDTEHIVFTSQVLNTAQIHFNQDLVDRDPAMQRQSGGKRLVVGTYVLAITLGLASEDTTENAKRIVRLKEARHTAPVFPMDTLYARTTVVAKEDAPDDPTAGHVTFLHEGLKADGETVCVRAEYTALVKRRNHFETGAKP